MEKILKKILLSFLILSVSLFATVTNQVASQKLINSNIPIVDIRTPAEWKETGLLKRAIPIMFFDEKGKYDIDMFLKKLNKAVDTTKPFAIICRSGNRSRIVSDFLSKNFNYNVINLEKGMIYAKSLGLPIVPYK
jgi:rhodanese-related sulfurtransferase